MRFTQYLAVAVWLTICASPAAANEYAHAIKAHAETVKAWLTADIIQSALKVQNDKHAGEHTRSLMVMDRQWKKELERESQPIISEVMGNSLSAFLKKKKEESQGLYTKIIVIDERGISAGLSDVTEDYWHGRKDIWEKTYRKGPKSILVSDLEKDDSSGKLQSRLSLPIPHSSGKYNIGAISIRLNVEMLEK